ncbi:MAG: hypothetical protein ABI833_07715 [Acidobacteriota bacterium]
MPKPNSHAVPGSGTPEMGALVKVSTVSVDMPPGTMSTTAVRVAASKLISRSFGKTDTLIRLVPACASSVMVANPSGN